MIERPEIPDKFIQPVVLGLCVRHLMQTQTRQWRAWHPGFGHTLAMGCGVASYWLWRALHATGRNDLSLAYGTVGGLGHCWLQDHEGNVVDVTATQFFPSAQKVEVMTEYAASVRHYHMEDCGHQVITDFKRWLPELQPSRYRKVFLPWIRTLS